MTVQPPSPALRNRSKAGPLLLLLLLLIPVGMCAPLCIAGGFAGSRAGTVPARVVLELDLENELGDAPAAGALFSTTTLTTRDVVFALEQAAKDDKVKGLFVRVGGAGHGLATAMELRDAILAFKKSGKPTLAYAESFGELSPGTGGWYIATAFDEIWLMPSGMVSLAPLFGETPFARDGLQKLGVEPQFSARKEYKNAPDTFTQQEFTAPHREATLRVLTSAQETMVAHIAASRPALGDAAAVATLLAGGPWDGKTAIDKKLVDTLGYRDEAVAAIKKKAGGTAEAPVELLWLSKYKERSPPPYDEGTVVAVVTGVGQIHRGRSNDDPLSSTRTIGSDTLASALRQAIDDEDVKAIVLRIDSPGGSVVASEAIAHEVERATKSGKPVVASMSNVAGSGGYYIAMNASAIVAQPGTITGSIGVYAGKVVTTKMWEQLGINFETAAVADADTSFFSTDVPYSDAARARLEGIVDGIYQSFVAKVAAGRKKTFEEIEPVARGRIWTGSDAKERGLVDELGGWLVALRVVREKLGLAADAPLHLKDFPKQRTPLEELLAALGDDEGDSSDKPALAYAPTHHVALPRSAADVARLGRALAGNDGDGLQLLVPALQVLP